MLIEQVINIKKLDLSVRGKLSIEMAILFNQISDESRIPFTHFIEQCSQPYKQKLDWWVASPASRNVLASPLFHYYCGFKLVLRLIEQKKLPPEIVVDSKAFGEILKKLFLETENSVNICLNRSWKSRIRIWLFPFLPFLFFAFHYFFIKLCAWKSAKVQKDLKISPHALIDTFVFPGFIENDRTYTGLWENLSAEEQEKIYFVPNLHGFSYSELHSTYCKLRKSQKKFLIKEDFLKISDYLYALSHSFRIFLWKFPNAYFEKVNVSSLIREELWSNLGYSSSVMGLLNYRFARRLKKRKFSMNIVINRFENQVIDKGWNAGFLKYFPEVKCIGYQGFIMSEQYLCMYPTRFEHECGVLPSTVAVIGKGHKSNRKEFFSDLKMMVAPALRFHGVWEERKYWPNKTYFTGLIALPIVVEDCCMILKLMEQSLSYLSEKHKPVRLWVKKHPAVTLKKIKQNYGAPLPECFNFIDADFNESVEQADLLFGNLSSTCLETLAKGIPVVVVGNANGLTHNPIPRSIENKIWCLANTPESIAVALEFYQEQLRGGKENFQETGDQIREDFFEPCNANGVRKLLQL